MDDEMWEPTRWDRAAWDEFFHRGGSTCSFCGKLVDDRRFATAIEIHRAWHPSSTETRYAHIDCLRAAMTLPLS
jgi:hypothetical protein